MAFNDEMDILNQAFTDMSNSRDDAIEFLKTLNADNPKWDTTSILISELTAAMRNLHSLKNAITEGYI